MNNDQYTIPREGGEAGQQAEHLQEKNVPPAPGDRLFQVKVIHSHETITGACGPELDVKERDLVIVSTKHGKDLGRVLCAVTKVNGADEEDVFSIHRKAQDEDLRRFDANRKKEESAFKICREKIERHSLEMKLVSTHYLLDEQKILFFFTADTRIDFRELVKDLVAVFKTRIELRQIGVRDEARVLGGMGICGRTFCCHSVTDRLNPVSIKMAKEQNISLNSLKISGPCGRLLCCLGYEYDFYHCEKRNLPEEGMRLMVNNEQFTITEINVLVKTVKLLGSSGRLVTLPFDLFRLGEDGQWSIDNALLNDLNIQG